MKIAYSHLINFLEERPSIEEISNNLFQLGHENEIIDDILDIEFTPNRGDCLSLLGLARDLGVFYNVIEPQKYYEGELAELKINFKNHSPQACPNISFLNIEVDEVPVKYQDYLEKYFSAFKLNKNNFFTDISNYIAYEMGQPTHCYDNSTINGDIEFKSDNLDEEFETLLDKNIRLSGINCVFKLNKKLINLAGIMGGKSTACKKNTKNVLIECAYFKPESIIGQAQKYNLHTDASYKFERGVDPSIQEHAIRRFIKIVSDHANIKNIQYKNFLSEKPPQKKIKFDSKKIQNIIGTPVQDDAYEESLSKIGFKVKDQKILIPPFRHDIAHQNDLAEEIARIIGYDNIKPSKFKIIKNQIAKKTLDDNLLRYFLASKGFNEVVNMPFTSKNTSSLKIDNPLDINKSFFRTTLKNSLLENLIFNEKRQKESIKMFEISDIYSINKNDEVEIGKYLGIIVSGRVGDNYIEFSQKLDDKYLINLLNLDKNQIFEIPRDLIDTKIKNKIFMALIKFNDLPESFYDLEKQKKHTINFKKYEPISDFPSSTRDLSFVLSDKNKIKQLEDNILNFKTDNLKNAFVFDFYDNTKTNQIKIGFRLIFNSKNKTLKVDDVDYEIDTIVKSCIKLGGIEIPGYTK